jgi:ABC-2 type transport system ATP-binding protein
MIDVEQIRKNYNGTRALDGFNLRVEEGELFGLVGPNGAGKSTLIKILSTLLRPNGGQARVAGFDVISHPQDVKRVVGYMPDQPGLYQDMRVREFLEFFSDAFHLPRERRREAVEQALERSGLAGGSEAFVEELSFGMKQKLFLAKTLLHNPKVLLLDEPATGLDPLARLDLRQQLSDLSAQGITILISSHILSDLESICSRIALIAEGKNANDGAGKSLIDLRSTGPKKQVYQVEVLGDATLAAQLAGQVPGVTILKMQGATVSLEISGEGGEASQLLKHLVTSGIEVVGFNRHAATLEDQYRKVFGGKSQ